MKQNIHTKLFALTLTTALALTALTACGNGAGTASLPEAPGTSTPLLEGSGGVAGTVLLSVNPEIEMDYDDLGNVVALTGRNQEAQTLLASYTGYEGRPCTQVVGELVDEINALGYFDATVGGHEKNIILKLERGSAYPSDQFLNELAEAVRLVVETDQIGSQAVTLDQDDYDDAYGDKGYINASAAQSILSTQLGRDDLQFVEKEYDLDDGEYEVEFILDGVEYEYEVNAYTGKVTEVDIDRQDDDRYDDDWDDRYDDDWDDRYDDDDDDDWYGDPTGSDYPGDSDDWDDRYDDDWDDRYDDDDDDDWYGDPTGSDYPGDSDDWDDRYDDDRDDRYDDDDDNDDDDDDDDDDDWDDDGWDD